MERLRRIRKLNGMTVRDLAKASGVAPSTISNVENGQRKPQDHTLEALAGALEVPLKELRRPIPASIPPMPSSPEQEEEELYEGATDAVWGMIGAMQEEVLERLRLRIDFELSRRWWTRKTKLEAEANGVTVEEYDKRIQDMYRQFKNEVGGTNEEWLAYSDKHWPFPLESEREEAKRERAASG